MKIYHISTPSIPPAWWTLCWVLERPQGCKQGPLPERVQNSEVYNVNTLSGNTRYSSSSKDNQCPNAKWKVKTSSAVETQRDWGDSEVVKGVWGVIRHRGGGSTLLIYWVTSAEARRDHGTHDLYTVIRQDCVQVFGKSQGVPVGWQILKAACIWVFRIVDV